MKWSEMSFYDRRSFQMLVLCSDCEDKFIHGTLDIAEECHVIVNVYRIIRSGICKHLITSVTQQRYWDGVHVFVPREQIFVAKEEKN